MSAHQMSISVSEHRTYGYCLCGWYTLEETVETAYEEFAKHLDAGEGPLSTREARLICDLLSESRTNPDLWTRAERVAVSRLYQFGATVTNGGSSQVSE